MTYHDAPPDIDRTPPNDFGAEQATLGAMLLARSAVDEVAEILVGGEDFYQPKHEQIYVAAMELFGRGDAVDAVTVARELEKRGQLAKVGDRVYLHDLMDAVPTAANAGYYAEIVRDKARLRAIIRAGMRMQQMGYTASTDDIDEIENRAQAEAFTLTTRQRRREEPSNSTALDEVLEDVENPGTPGLPTGFLDLDALLGGLHPGQLILVAARTGLGKSTLDLDIHRHVSIHCGKHSALFTFEMTRKQIIRRALSAELRIPLSHFRHGQMTDREWAAIAEHRARIENAPMHIVTDRSMTLPQIKARARQIAKEHPLKLLSLDYIQQITTGSRVENRQQEVTTISRETKILAEELNIPIIAVAQLNRGPEGRSDKKPMKSDMRESGSLEQDADVVILIHREDAYEREHPRAGEADLIIDKHRDGPPTTITVAFQGHYSRFVDMARA